MRSLKRFQANERSGLTPKKAANPEGQSFLIFVAGISVIAIAILPSSKDHTNASLLLDGNALAIKPVTLARDEEKKIEFDAVIPAGLHVVAVDNLRACVRRDAP